MKNLVLFGIFSTVVLTVSCQKEEGPSSYDESLVSICAGFEQISPGTKATETDFRFAWEEGDQIAIAKADGSGFETYTSEAAGASTSFVGAPGSFQKYAVYPAGIAKSVSGDVLTVTMPNEYHLGNIAGHRTTYSPMLAVFDGNSPEYLSFRHLGALIRLTIKDLPAGACMMEFETEKRAIAGDFKVEKLGDSYEIRTRESNRGTRITLHFDRTTEILHDVVFYVPVPAGEYTGGYNATFYDSDDEIIGFTGCSDTVTLNRRVCAHKETEFGEISGEIE